MSGVYISGMEMPSGCAECPLEMYYFNTGETRCRATNKTLETSYCPTSYEKRDSDCPRVSAPPHGRLIDAEALMHEFEKAERTMAQHGREYSCSFMSSSQEISTEWYCVEDMLENAPTIISASEEGET